MEGKGGGGQRTKLLLYKGHKDRMLAGIRHIVDHCLFWGKLVYFVELINLQSITELST